MIQRRLRVVVCVAVFASGCITVGDFGAYWDRDPLDGDLEGTWVAVKSKNDEGGELTFTRRGRVYELTTREEGGKAESAEEQVRTLRVGNDRYLLARPPGKTPGFMAAYRIMGDRLELLETPDVDAIGNARPRPPSIAYARRAGTPVIAVETLDQAALDWLAHVNATAQPGGVYTRRR